MIVLTNNTYYSKTIIILNTKQIRLLQFFGPLLAFINSFKIN